MSTKLLRYKDLEERNIVSNRATLRNWQDKYGFPSGTMITPNCRVWTEDEIEEWLAERARRPQSKEPKKVSISDRHVSRRRLAARDGAEAE